MLLLKGAVVFLLISYTVAYSTNTYSSNRYRALLTKSESHKTHFSFNQIYKILNRALKCLEKTPDLSIASNTAVVNALATLYETFVTVPTISPAKAELINGLIERLERLIEKAFENYPDYPLNKVWHAKYFVSLTDFSFKYGRVPKHYPFDKTFAELIEELSRNQAHTDQCILNLFLDNKRSDEKRTCTASCQEEMTNMDYYTGATPFQKAWYVGFMLTLNCTNLIPKTYDDYVAHLCGYVKREVDTIMLSKHTEEFHNHQSEFLTRVLYCGGWGFPEFLSPEIMAAILKLLDCRGCAAFYNNPEEQQMLTSQIMAILSSLLRLSAQLSGK